MESNPRKIQLLRFYVSNTDKVKHTSVYEALAFAAKRYGMAGTTVYKGIMGYGAKSKLRSDKFWELTEKIPVIVEIVDEASKIKAFVDKVMPVIQKLPKGCMVTCQNVDVLFCPNPQLMP